MIVHRYAIRTNKHISKKLKWQKNIIQTKILRKIHHKNKPSTISTKFDLPNPPKKFKILCYLFGFTISLSSLFLLRENLLFGTAAGIIAKTSTAPLERVVTHKQASIDTDYSISSTIKTILEEEGIYGLWRGNGINVLRASLQKGSLFALNDFFRKLICSAMDIDNINISNNKSIIFLCGSLAGTTSTLISYPLDPVKTVNQATIHSNRWPAITIWYSLCQIKGYLKGPWIALTPTFFGTTFYYGIKFTAFEAVVHGIDHFCEKHEIKIQHDVRNGIAGFFAGVSGSSAIYWNNCVRKRMYTANVCVALGIDSAYIAANYKQTIVQLWNEGGIARFYRGFGINILRNAPNTAIQFIVYKRLQKLFQQS